ncbi:MAG: hypothetical protein KDE58_30250, partial [Caldilineaceae bacterium]|nr:hypothetical protein [Caldilineaceae bacterium]
YRFVDTAKGEFYAWQEARQIPEQGGTFIYVTGIQEDFLIQLRIEYGDTHWQSRAMPTQSLPIELIQIGGD